MIRKDLKLFISDGKTILVLLALLVLGIAGIFLASGVTPPTQITVGIADLEQSNYSNLLKSYFANNEDFNAFVTIYEGTVDEVDERFEKGELDFYFVIPENFTEEMIRMKNTPVKAVINSDDKAKAAVYGALLDSYSRYITSVEVNIEALTFRMQDEDYDRSVITDRNFEISWDLVTTALGKDAFFERVPFDRLGSIPLTDHYIYSVLVLLVLYAGMLTGYSVLLERKSGVRSRLITCGISPVRQILSKVFVYGTLMTFFFVTVMTGMSCFGKIVFSVSTALYLTMLIYGACIVFSLIGLMIGSGNGYCFFSNMAILMMTVLGGGIIPVMYLPSALSGLAQFTPVYRFITFILKNC